MIEFQVGGQIIHDLHGPCRVTFVGTDYIGVRTEDGQNVLLRKSTENVVPWNEENDAAWQGAVAEMEAQKEIEVEQRWPESTFIFETEETEHYIGSHWEPFGDQAPENFLTRLPEIIKAAGVVEGFGAIENPPRSLPESWAAGFHLIWPHPDRGLVMTVAIDEAAQQTQLRAMFPFWLAGIRHRLVMLDVAVWESGVEAHISAGLGETDITFFDVHYLLNRGWYERGQKYDFILSGIAYSARAAENVEIPFSPPPDQIAWDTMLAHECGEEVQQTPTTIRLDGAAFFLPISEWDQDDYSFRGPVKDVQPFDDFLGQRGWLVRITVMRLSDYLTEDIDLNIVITCQAWERNSAPKVGEDIEGSLWLQGYLEKTQ
jgi:hypothetical protein